ncbi:probable serine/threonine-protein kinase PIX13 isoform X2 [Ricinus communis]|uniref:non-specific serine/threonine protein kinase n=1 Tax=Ricinus communis TaxID=3988 RepID=B9SBW7_RICCO|nr:probable serine/threonine-protein kinase PIX13 isoform X2 [Ricinus communis]EEF38945.1 serine/threonine-protein kinase cx32, putative [Ricinus communis]|eukprot:XP_015577448.1 probable serine/threonine-protein kinase PIX13 isoform X2 [Ricinus communis]
MSSGDTSFLDGNFSGESWFSMASTNLTTWASQANEKISAKLGINARKHKEVLLPIENMRLLDREITADSNLMVFTLEELKLATFNFKREKVLGRGGFGNVYKGRIRNKIPCQDAKMLAIAVKKLEASSRQGFQQWRTEVNLLGRLSHPNIVKLLGYCQENQSFLIVYEFMENGSLNYHLFRKDSKYLLPWETRIKVMIGMARGLSYLHTIEDPIIYRDFKSSNILLDESYIAKISDFGLAKRRCTPDIVEIEECVIGTNGYAAPEYIATGKVDIKSDVYGFGVVLIEMLTGLRAIDKRRPAAERKLLDWIKPHLSSRRELKDIMDSRLQGKYAFKEASEIARIALRCVDPYYKRPSMSEVVDRLEKIGVPYRIDEA